MSESWIMQLDTLIVDDADEEGTFSDGDEPFLAAIGFRARLGTPGSAHTFWGGMLDDKWGDHARDGSQRAIPAQMGVLHFDGVDRPSLQQIQAGAKPEIVGRVTVVVESDGTPWGTIKDVIERAQTALKDELVTLVENEQIDRNDPQKSLREASERVKAFALRNLDLGDWFESWSDPDDFMGVTVDAYVAADPALANVVPFPLLDQRSDELSFSDNDTRYRLTGNVRRTRSWTWLGGAFTSPPAVVSWAPNRLDIFALGDDRAMYQKTWDGSQWLPSHDGWTWLGGAFTSPPAVVSWAPNRLDIFALGDDRAMYQKTWDGSQWLPW
jgi:hypothetical protein